MCREHFCPTNPPILNILYSYPTLRPVLIRGSPPLSSPLPKVTTSRSGEIIFPSHVAGRGGLRKLTRPNTRAWRQQLRRRRAATIFAPLAFLPRRIVLGCCCCLSAGREYLSRRRGENIDCTGSLREGESNPLRGAAVGWGGSFRLGLGLFGGW